MRRSTELRTSRRQKGQAIVLVGLILVALFGFLGLALDGGRGYLDRRAMQVAVDAAALAAAYNYMNNSDYTQAEQAATTEFANNERLYMSPTCGGYGSLSVSCSFNDSTNQAVTQTVADHSIAGTTFTVTATHSIPVTIMQVLGSGSTMTVTTTATAVARRTGTNGAAIQTLSPAGCPGGGNSLTFQGNSTTTVVGDVWSNGNVFEQSGAAGGSINGNVSDICPAPPAPLTSPRWSISGSQVNGFTIPDPGYPTPPVNNSSQNWGTQSCGGECPGTYASDPNMGGGAGCFFLAGGVYTFAGGYSQNGGFVSNELKPPDEPLLTATTSSLAGPITSIPVSALSGAVPANSTVTVAGQAFVVTSAGAASGATSIPVNSKSVSGSIASGTTVVTMARSPNQFWDANGASCGSSFTLTRVGSSGFANGTYSVQVTSVRWEPNGVSSCSGPASPTCYQRESAPSMCRTIALGSSGNIKVSVAAVPGAQDYNVYVATNGSCTDLAYCADTGNGNASVTINTCAAGQAPPDPQNPAPGPGLGNANPSPGTPPRGDLANEGHCVNTSTGNDTACPTTFVPGAVAYNIPSTGCVNLHGRADIYLFSGYQYSRVVLFEPGPEQSSSPNTCSNIINGGGYTSFIGIFYVPAANVQINGGNTYRATIAGGVIAWTVTITGNGGVSISADPTLRKWPPTVHLTQ